MDTDYNIKLILEAQDKATAEIQRMQKSIELLSKTTETSTKGISKNFSDLSSAIAGLGIRETLKTGVGSVVDTFADFEKQMSTAKATLGLFGDTKEVQTQFKQLNDLAIELGANTKFTAKEAAEGITILGQAGFKTNEIMKALPGTLDLAAATNISIADSADIASSVLRQYGLDVSETSRVMDVLAKTSIDSNANIKDLSESFNYFGPTAKALGVSIEESAATIGILANSGIKGSLATRALGTAMTRLAKPTDDMHKVMQKLNIDAFDQKGNFIGVANLVGQLETSFKGLTQEQQAMAVSTLFGADAYQEMTVLINGGAESIRNFSKELGNAGGTTDKMAKEQMNNLRGSIELLSGSFDSLKLRIGASIAPAINALMQQLIPVVDFIGQFAQKNPELTATIVGLTTAFLGLVSGIAILTPILGALATAVGVIMGPVGLVIAGVIALGVAFATNFAGIRDTVMSAVSAIGSFLSDAATDIQNSWNEMLQSMGMTNQDVRNGIKETVIVTVAILKTVIQVGFELIKGMITSAVSFVSSYVTRTFTGIKDVVQGITKTIRAVVNGDFQGMVKGIAQAFGGVYKIITAPFMAAKDAVVAMINGMIGGINKLIDSINEIGKVVGLQIPNIKKLGEETIKAQAGRKHDIEAEKKGLVELAKRYNNIKDIVTKTQKQSEGATKNVTDNIKNNTYLSTAKGGGGGGGGGASSALKEANDLAKEQANLAYKVEQANDKAYSTIKDAGQKAYDAIIDRVGKSKEKMADFDMKIIDTTKKFKDMQASLSKDIGGIDMSIRGLSEQTMKDLSVRSVEVTKTMADMQKQLTKEEDADKKAELQKQLAKLQEEQAFLMGNTTEEARKQADAYASMSESQKIVFNQQQQINDLMEKQNIMKSFQGGKLDASNLSFTGEGQQLQAFYKNNEGVLIQITDLKNIQYAQELADKQIAVQNELATLQAQKDAEKLILEQAEKDKALFEDMRLQKLQLSTDAQVAMLARVEQKYYDVAMARSMAEGGQSVSVPPSAPKQASGQTFNFAVDGTQFNLGGNQDFNKARKKLGSQFLGEATRKTELQKEHGVK